jgi:eukaryotic-like serine/threonine-protein kinase
MNDSTACPTPQVALRVEEVCARFEGEWQAGRQPRFSDYLGSAAAPEYKLLLQELVWLDVYYRRKAGQNPMADDYRSYSLPDADQWLTSVHLQSAAPPPPSLPSPDPGGGVRWVGYELLEEIGRGGMGVVYKARQLQLGRLVAVKMILHGDFAESQAKARLRSEAEAIARLQHPNILQIFEIGEHDGKPFLALEFCGGGSLHRQLNATPQPPREAAQQVHILARAVEAAHAKQILHRDLKPSNVLLTDDGTLKIADFGLAKRLDSLAETASGAILGSPSYMAPEQAYGKTKALGPSCDVYALGAILYEFLTGRPPFRAATMVETLSQVVNDEPVAPTRLQPKIPRDLETICLKCLSKEPQKRYATALALADDLERWLGGRPIVARPVGSAERAYRWCRQNPVVASLLGGIVLLLAGIAVVFLVSAQRLQRQLDRADQAEGAEKVAKQEALYKLWEAYLNEANARHFSGRRGQRFESLRAIREALILPVPPGRSKDELRNAAIAALCLPDIGKGPEWNPAVGPAQQEEPAFRLKLEQNRQWTRVPEPKYEPRGQTVSPDCRFVLCALAPYFPGKGDKHMTVPMGLWCMDGPEPRMVLDDDAVYEMASAFRPDGKQLALGHPNGSVTVYDTDTGQPVQRLAVEKGRPYCMAYHPSLPLLAIGVNPTLDPKVTPAVYIFDPDSGKLMRRLAHPQGVSCLAWRPDGRRLVTSCGDMHIRLWDTDSGSQITAPWSGHKVNGIRFSFNRAGDRLVSNDWSEILRLWDTLTGRELFNTPEVQYAYVDSPPALLEPLGLGKKLDLLRVAEGQELRQLFRSTPAGKEIIGVAGHPDGRLQTARSTEVHFLDMAAGEAVALLPVKQRAVDLVHFDGSGSMWTLAAGALYCWPVRRPTANEHAYRIGPPERIADLPDETMPGWSKDGQVVAIPQRDKGTLVVLRREGNRKVLLEPQSDVRFCSVSPDGRWVAAQTFWPDNSGVTIRIWDVSSGKKVKDFLFDQAVFVGGFSPDGRWLITTMNWMNYPAHLRTKIFHRRWEVGTWLEGERIPTEGTIFWDQDILMDGSQSDGSIILLQISTGRELARLASPENGRSSPGGLLRSGYLLATAQESGIMYVWDLPLIRAQLAEMGLDWAGPPYFSPDEVKLARSPYTVQVDAGSLAK